jgi:hypothetical protein
MSHASALGSAGSGAALQSVEVGLEGGDSGSERDDGGPSGGGRWWVVVVVAASTASTASTAPAAPTAMVVRGAMGCIGSMVACGAGGGRGVQALTSGDHGSAVGGPGHLRVGEAVALLEHVVSRRE